MKNLKFLLVFMCILFVNYTSTEAARNACSTATKKELAVAANYVKVDYEIKDKSEEKTIEVDGQKTTYKVPNYSFEFSVYNVTEKIYVQIQTASTNGQSKNLFAYNTDTKDGTYTFTDNNFGEIYNYTIAIKSNDPECQGTTLRTIKLTKPRYNAYSEFTYCQNSSNFYCQRFIGTEINLSSTDEFLSKIKVNNEKNNPDKDIIDTKKEIATIFKNNWRWYLLIFIGIVVVVVAGIFLIRKHNLKKGWKL